MPFKQDFEKNMNKDLEEDHKDTRTYSPPPPMNSRSYPPPPPIDMEMQQDRPPIHIFPSYPPPIPYRSGIHVPTYLFVLFVVLFLFESGVLFIYTVVALWNTTGPVLAAVPMPACNCPAAAPMIVYPNGAGVQLAATAATVTQMAYHDFTVTITPSASASEATSTSASSSISKTGSAIEALLSAFDKTQTSASTSSSVIVTVTAPVPTTTILSTASVDLPSITTLIVLSTTMATPTRSTVTSTTTASST